MIGAELELGPKERALLANWLDFEKVRRITSYRGDCAEAILGDGLVAAGLAVHVEAFPTSYRRYELTPYGREVAAAQETHDDV